jgi:predicted DNA-binding transcriptional regulator AlpA|tara:strand:- start:536 stop:751 length:216 start_codon:yes stop_codon:yes gene_type:complete
MEKSRDGKIEAELLDVNGLAAMLSMSRTSLYKIRTTDASFPEPAFKKPRRWTRTQIINWIDKKSHMDADDK